MKRFFGPILSSISRDALARMMLRNLYSSSLVLLPWKKSTFLNPSSTVMNQFEFIHSIHIPMYQFNFLSFLLSNSYICSFNSLYKKLYEYSKYYDVRNHSTVSDKLSIKNECAWIPEIPILPLELVINNVLITIFYESWIYEFISSWIKDNFMKNISWKNSKYLNSGFVKITD